MFEKGSKKGTYRFAFTPEGEVKTVFLAGDFNGWEPCRMRKQKAGCYVCNVPLEPGTYQYKFIVDDEWLTDSDNEAAIVNDFGTLNSVMIAY